ncbi:PREDICTED: coiled-coil domain-containing protein 102B [Calidris pugnax]|uniref:coiled-coil domain-containing protein 102B n=1 Tax=Calidris pugnax TaxID=198806 RepID=UPI00071C63A1|nr:PREDICTED: coiled-coil domain-containing protein 102B [Calidris pugnax]
MNLDSVQKLMEESQAFGTQPRQPYKFPGGCKPGDDLCNSNLPSQSFTPCSSHYPHMSTNCSSDWEILEAVRIRELEEAKARAAQMEKTMRWWSDCTANWREKWSKVRAERNKAREEARQLRIKLDSVVKELSMLKKINQGLVSEKENSENITAWKTELSCSEISCIRRDLSQLTFLEGEPVKELLRTNKIPGAEDTKKDVEAIKDQNKQNKNITPKAPDSFPSAVPSVYLEEPKKSLDNAAKTTENDLIRASVLHLHLAEMQKILEKEREMNMFLEKEMEKIENELFIWKWKYEELRQTKLEGLKQQERVWFADISEWGKRERLEAEKQSLEEENRRLESQVKEIQELLEMKNQETLTESSCDHQNAQSKLLVENKVIYSTADFPGFPGNELPPKNYLLLKSKETEESELGIWDQTKLLVCCWKF